MKKCFKCGKKKSIFKFYTHEKMTDKHLNKCIECTKMDTKKRLNELSKNPEWYKMEKARHREKYYRLGYKDKNKPTLEKRNYYNKKYKITYPEKIYARSLSQHILVKKGFHNHHWSYKKENAKDIIRLKIKDHCKLHRFIIYDQERNMYRRCDTMELLDTKEKHLAYFKVIKNKQ